MSVMPGKRRRTARSVTTNRLPVDQRSSGSTWCSKPTMFRFIVHVLPDVARLPVDEYLNFWLRSS